MAALDWQKVAMRDIIFAHTRYVYPSYTDYRRLVELAGFETCFVDQIDFTRKNVVYIVSPLNGEYRPHRDNWRKHAHNAHVVWWSLERPGPSGIAEFVRGTKRLLDDWYFDEVWLSDRYLCEQCHDKRVRFVVLGSHPALGQPRRSRRRSFQYDIVHLSYLTPRRQAIIDPLTNSLDVAPNGWGEARDRILAASAFMLNVHQDDWLVLEPLRFALAAAWALPMISEHMIDPYPYNRGETGHYIKQVHYDDLVGEVLNAVRGDYEQFRAMGRRMHDLMTTEFGFRRQVELAVAVLDRRPLDPLTLR